MAWFTQFIWETNMRRIYQNTAAVLALLALAGCQTANVAYEKIGYDCAKTDCVVDTLILSCQGTSSKSTGIRARDLDQIC